MKIFLIGMMGSGKSYWKKILSTKLKTGGYDLDFLIESHEEKTIAEIFEEDGEAAFRASEAKVLRWFAEKKNFVLATGGGTPCFHNNMQWMNEQGLTIWIDETAAILAQRLAPEKAHRPLIKNLTDEQLESHLQNRLNERMPFYSQAKVRLQGDDIKWSVFQQIISEHA